MDFDAIARLDVAFHRADEDYVLRFKAGLNNVSPNYLVVIELVEGEMLATWPKQSDLDLNHLERLAVAVYRDRPNLPFGAGPLRAPRNGERTIG